MSNDERALSWSRKLLIGAVVWLCIAGLLVLGLWPDLPHSAVQWAFLVALGPPLYLLGEAFFDWQFSREQDGAISPERLSIKRIAIALPIALTAFAVSWWLSWLVTKS